MTRPRRFPHRPKRSSKNYVRFLVIAISLLFLVDYFFFKDGRPYVDDIVELEESSVPPLPTFDENTVEVTPDGGGEYFEADAAQELEIVEPDRRPQDDDDIIPQAPEGFGFEEEDGFFFEDFFFADEDEFMDEETSADLMPEIPDFTAKPDTSNPLPDSIEEEEIFVPAPQSSLQGNGGKIAIVIDDMGMNLKQSRAAIALPSEVTLAFLPYAEKVRPLSAQAKSEGHELIIHAPMEAMDSKVPLGALAFRESMDWRAFEEEFEKMAQSFEGYDGVNNHMGSKLTQIPEHMGYLMAALKSRDLYFLDSRTIHSSVASDMAAAYGVPTIERDVFLDHEDSPEYVAGALAKVEKLARDHGAVVAIGHPKENTMQTLKKWIPTLEKRGFELVPLSDLILGDEKIVLKDN